MLIKSISIDNFRQFKGHNVLNFSTDANKNVTIILGNNSFGKTTLLQAFYWCFYGKVNFNDKEALLNNDIKEKMKCPQVENVKVEICIQHAKKEYTFIRKQEYRSGIDNKPYASGSNNFDIYIKESNGENYSVPSKHTEKVTDEILPEKLSNYFFFDTERIDSISDKNDIKDAVKGLLGITIYESAIKHLGARSKSTTVLGKYQASLSVKSDEATIDYQVELKSHQEKEDLLNKRLENKKDELEKYNNEADRLKKLLLTYDESLKIQKKREQMERKIKEKRNKYEEEINDFFKNFSEYNLKFFMQPLLRKADDMLKSLELQDVDIKDLTKSTIDDLLRRGKCLCGCELIEGNEAYNSLMNLIKSVPPESIGQTVKTYKERLNAFHCDLENVINKFDKNVNNIDELSDEINDEQEEINSLGLQLENIDRIKNDVFSLNQTNSKINEISNEIDSINREIGSEQKLIEQCTKNIEKYSISSDKNGKIKKYMKYADFVLNMFQKRVETKTSNIIDRLQEKVNNIFQKMYTGKRRVVISQDYNVQLYTDENNSYTKLDDSQGTICVKNFAFIAGLVELAKEQFKKDDDNLVIEPYPLVMDAPFSNADSEHTKNISKVLPSIAEQVIMFVMQKDWEHAQDVIQPKLGKLYKLVKNSETYTSIGGELNYV